MDIESLEQLARSFLATAKSIKESGDGQVVPIVAVVEPDGNTSVIAVPIGEDVQEKRAAYGMIRQFMKPKGGIASISVNDAWYYTSPKGKDEIDLEHATPPSEHPDRKECIMVILTTPLGCALHIMQPYHTENQQVVWDKIIETRPGVDGLEIHDRLLGSPISDTMGVKQ